jgi:DNA invertase Pin-like site-specific DNA recombinase
MLQGCAAVYARYSSDLQDNSSIDGQIRKARDWAEKNGFIIHEQLRFIDEAISGTKDRRPGLDQMLAAAERGEFDLLIVESLSRLARSHVYASTVMMKLVYVLKIRIVGIDDGCDTNNSNWELLAGIKNILNEQFIRDLGKMVRRGHIENLMQGFSAGDLCFGYKSEPVQENRIRRRNQTAKKRYVIDEEKARWVRKIFDWFVNEKRSLQWIAKKLTQLKVPKDNRATTSSWNHCIVQRILSNKKYLGVWAWGQKRTERNPITGKIRCVKCSPEEVKSYTRLLPELRLIGDSLFTQAQALLEERKITQFGKNRGLKQNISCSPKYLLSGLVKCGICGKSFYIGGRNRQYIYCQNHRSGGDCENGTQLPRLLAEKLILQQVTQKILTNNRWIDAIHNAIKDSILKNYNVVLGKIKCKERAVIELRQKIDRLLDQIEDAVPIPELRQRLEIRTEELNQAEIELQELRSRSGKTMPVPNRDWVLGKLSNLEKVITGAMPSANIALKKLLDTPITVVPIKIPEKKRCFLRGTIRFRAGKIAATLTGNELESENDFVEEIVIDFKKTTYRDKQRQKVVDL